MMLQKSLTLRRGSLHAATSCMRRLFTYSAYAPETAWHFRSIAMGCVCHRCVWSHVSQVAYYRINLKCACNSSPEGCLEEQKILFIVRSWTSHVLIKLLLLWHYSLFLCHVMLYLYLYLSKDSDISLIQRSALLITVVWQCSNVM